MPKRPAGWKHSDEARAKISQSLIEAHRVRSPVTAEHHRAKIKTGQLISRLHSVGMGIVEASPTSVQACIALLRKTLPDLGSVEHKHDAMVTLRTIITGVVRAEDLAASHSLPKLIEHEPSPCDPSASSSDPAVPQTAAQSNLRADRGEGGGE